MAERIFKQMNMVAPDALPHFGRSIQEFGDRASNSISTIQFLAFCNQWRIKFATPHQLLTFLSEIGVRAPSGYGGDAYYLDLLIE